MNHPFCTKLFLCWVLLSSVTASAQNFEFGTLTQQDLNFNRNQIDSNANAVVLREFGTARIIDNDNTHRMEIVYDYHVRIKIINEKGFSKANIVIPLYKDDTKSEEISDLRASTFNTANGSTEEASFDARKIFMENRSRYTRLAKFTLPNIRPGSIIEYSYRISSPNIFNFRTWVFQDDIPKVYSEFIANIPANFNYNVALRGFLKLSKSSGTVEKECIRLSGIAVDCSRLTYVMERIPAFIEEDYMTAPGNFLSAIYFELSDIQNVNGTRQSFTKTWRDADAELASDARLGAQMKRKEVFKDLIPGVVRNATTELEKAKAVYNFIKKEIRWNQYFGKYSEENIKKALETHSGNTGDINLALIAALTSANLDAEAVLVSTRDNGFPNKLFPVISGFNYLVAKVNIGEKSYFLDATEPLLPFGMLPMRCINDQGRVISLKKPSYWIDLKNEQRSQTTYYLEGTLQPDGKIKGIINISYSGFPALEKRKEIKRANSIEEYVEKLDDRMSRVSLKDPKISNIDSVENILSEQYAIEFEVFENGHGEMFSLNPFLVNRISRNPFNLDSRVYPVDMGAPSTEMSVINIKLNDGYVLEAKPENVALSLPANGGRFLLNTALTEQGLSINQNIQFNKAIYP